MLARAEDAICRSVFFGSAAKPNCCFNFVSIVVVICSDLSWKAFSSVTIVSVCFVFACRNCRLWRRCWYLLLLRFRLLVVGCVVAKWSARVGLPPFVDLTVAISFCSRHLVGPSQACFFVSANVRPNHIFCCIIAPVIAISCRVCHTLF